MPQPDRDDVLAAVRGNVQEFLSAAKKYQASDPRVTLFYARLIVEAMMQCWLFLETGTRRDLMVGEANKEGFGGSSRDSTGTLSDTISKELVALLGTGWMHGNLGVHYSIKSIAPGERDSKRKLVNNATVALEAVEPAVRNFLMSTAGLSSPETSAVLTGFGAGFLAWEGPSGARSIQLSGGARGTAALSFDGRIAARILGEQLEFARLSPLGGLSTWRPGPALEPGQRLLAVKTLDHCRVRCLLTSATSVALTEVTDGEEMDTLETFSEPGRAAVLTDRGTWLLGQGRRLYEDPWDQGGLRLGGLDLDSVLDIDAASRGAECFIGLLVDSARGRIVRLHNFTQVDRLRRDRWEAVTASTVDRLMLSRLIGDAYEMLPGLAQLSLRTSEFVRLPG